MRFCGWVGFIGSNLKKTNNNMVLGGTYFALDYMVDLQFFII